MKRFFEWLGYVRIKEYKSLEAYYIRRIEYLEDQLKKARKNDHRDPKTGRFVKG